MVEQVCSCQLLLLLSLYTGLPVGTEWAPSWHQQARDYEPKHALHASWAAEGRFVQCPLHHGQSLPFPGRDRGSDRRRERAGEREVALGRGQRVTEENSERREKDRERETEERNRESERD